MSQECVCVYQVRSVVLQLVIIATDYCIIIDRGACSHKSF